MLTRFIYTVRYHNALHCIIYYSFLKVKLLIVFYKFKQIFIFLYRLVQSLFSHVIVIFVIKRCVNAYIRLNAYIRIKAACIKKYQKIKSTSKVKFISLHSISNKHTQKSSKQKALMLTRKSSKHKLI